MKIESSRQVRLGQMDERKDKQKDDRRLAFLELLTEPKKVIRRD